MGRQLRAGKDQVPSSAPLGPTTFGLKPMKVWPVALRITGLALGFPNRGGCSPFLASFLSELRGDI